MTCELVAKTVFEKHVGILYLSTGVGNNFLSLSCETPLKNCGEIKVRSAHGPSLMVEELECAGELLFLLFCFLFVCFAFFVITGVYTYCNCISSCSLGFYTVIFKIALDIARRLCCSRGCLK